MFTSTIKCPSCNKRNGDHLQKCRSCGYPIQSDADADHLKAVSVSNSWCVTCGLRFHAVDSSIHECSDCNPVANPPATANSPGLTSHQTDVQTENSKQSRFGVVLVTAFLVGSILGIGANALQEEPSGGEKFLSGVLVSGVIVTVLVAVVYGMITALKPNHSISKDSAPLSPVRPKKTTVGTTNLSISTNSLADELTKLGELKKQGLLSEAEFQTAKSKLLS